MAGTRNKWGGADAGQAQVGCVSHKVLVRREEIMGKGPSGLGVGEEVREGNGKETV